MNIQEEKPYLPYVLAMLFLALPIFLLLFDGTAIFFRQQSGFLLGMKNGQYFVQDIDDSVVFAAVVCWFFNAIITAGLYKVAKQKMMRRQFHYTLYLTGVGSGMAWLCGVVLLVAADVSRQNVSAAWLVCYALTIGIIARLFLPKQLTRAPVQTMTFHKNTFR